VAQLTRRFKEAEASTARSKTGTADFKSSELTAVELVAKLDELQRKIEDDEKKGDYESALAAAKTYTTVAENRALESNRDFAPRVAAGWNQVGLLYHKEGDIDQAERALARANEINRNTLGENHEATKQTCYYLANVYENAQAHRDPPAPVMDYGPPRRPSLRTPRRTRASTSATNRWPGSRIG